LFCAVLHCISLPQWDRIDVSDPGMTVDGLIDMLSADYGVELSMLSSGVTILFSDFMDRKKMKVRTGCSVELCRLID
jgi:hypothetical protein